MSEIQNNLYFPLYLKKVENGATFLKTKTMAMVIGIYDAEFGYPLKLLTTYYRYRDLTLGFFLNIRLSKWAFFYFNTDLQFQSNLL